MISWICIQIFTISFIILKLLEIVSGKTSGYNMAVIDCPAENIVRPADGISKEEEKYLQGRKLYTQRYLHDFVARQNLKDINADDYFPLPNDDLKSSEIPPGINLGISLSGGGLRSLSTAGGFLAALDSRDQPSFGRGKLAGLLQGASHIAGVSGGGWLVGSLYMNDFKTIEDLLNSSKVWQFKNNLFLPNGKKFMSDVMFYTQIAGQMGTKLSSGARPTMTDVYGRLLAALMIEKDAKGLNPGIQWSDMEKMEFFQNRSAPYPIITAVGRTPNKLDIYPNNTLFEITPH